MNNLSILITSILLTTYLNMIRIEIWQKILIFKKIWRLKKGKKKFIKFRKFANEECSLVFFFIVDKQKKEKARGIQGWWIFAEKGSFPKLGKIAKFWRRRSANFGDLRRRWMLWYGKRLHVFRLVVLVNDEQFPQDTSEWLLFGNKESTTRPQKRCKRFPSSCHSYVETCKRLSIFFFSISIFLSFWTSLIWSIWCSANDFVSRLGCWVGAKTPSLWCKVLSIEIVSAKISTVACFLLDGCF